LTHALAPKKRLCFKTALSLLKISSPPNNQTSTHPLSLGPITIALAHLERLSVVADTRLSHALSKAYKMKVLKKQISAKDGSGLVLLRPETPEDLWHAYNLLQVGDLVRCTTLRKVIKESNTGSTSSSKKRMSLTINLQKIDFDPQSLQVRLSGITTSESDVVRLGSHHTLTLELEQNFSLEKTCWDQIYLDLIEEACHPERQSEIAACVMQTGLAHVCLIAGSLTVTKARIEVNIPKKRTGSSHHCKAIARFYEAVYQALLKYVPWTKIKVLLIGSPGFVKDDFWAFVQKEAVRRDDRVFIENKAKVLLVKASSGHKHALEEVLGDASIAAQMTETKVAKEVQVLHRFMRYVFCIYCIVCRTACIAHP
jgi:protein pelota